MTRAVSTIPSPALKTPSMGARTAAKATPAPVDRSQEKVCHHEKETGSYIGKKVCRTRAEEELALRVARATAEQMNSNSAINRGDTSGMAGGGDGDAAQH